MSNYEWKAEDAYYWDLYKDSTYTRVFIYLALGPESKILGAYILAHYGANVAGFDTLDEAKAAGYFLGAGE